MNEKKDSRQSRHLTLDLPKSLLAEVSEETTVKEV